MLKAHALAEAGYTYPYGVLVSSRLPERDRHLTKSLEQPGGSVGKIGQNKFID